MKKFLMIITVALAACATTLTPSGAVAVAYSQVRMFQTQVGLTVQRGAISTEKARELRNKGDEMLVMVDKANDALIVCGAKPKCFEVDNILNQLNGSLADAERRLRQEQKQ